MESLIEKTQNVLRYEFPEPDRVAIESTNSDKVTGYIVSSSFEGIRDSERQNHIWDVLEKNLSEYELTRIILIIAITPEEHSAKAEG